MADQPKTKKVAGIDVPLELLGVRRGRKGLVDGAWILSTRHGVRLAQFASEAELDSWWQAFQESEGRASAHLVQRPAGNPGLRRRRKRRIMGRSRRGIEPSTPVPLPALPRTPEVDLSSLFHSAERKTRKTHDDDGKTGQWW
jgi:hypothetical protein